MVARKSGKIDGSILDPLIIRLEMIDTVSDVELCRDPDDNKFLNCAIDTKALYIVSGDRDLLVLEKVEGTSIITAKEFCERYLLPGITLD